MSDTIYAGLDYSTPFVSAAEEASSFADSRYASDPAFREAVEAKLSLGIKHNDATPSGRRVGGALRFTATVNEEGAVTGSRIEGHDSEQTRTTETDLRNEQSRQALEAERDALLREQRNVTEAQPTRDLGFIDSPDFYVGCPKFVSLEGKAFASMEEQVAAQGSAGYRNDPEIRSWIIRRIAAS